jgi:hypothetical protein
MLKIQISNPLFSPLECDEELSMDEIIELLFPLENEYLFLIWNNIFIPLSYKYDISVILDDFIEIVNFLDQKNVVKQEIHWPSNTFSAKWILEKDDNKINITSEWFHTLGNLTTLLNSVNYMSIDQDTFRHEILKLLIFIKNTIQNNTSNQIKIINYASLEKIVHLHNNSHNLWG